MTSHGPERQVLQSPAVKPGHPVDEIASNIWPSKTLQKKQLRVTVRQLRCLPAKTSWLSTISISFAGFQAETWDLGFKRRTSTIAAFLHVTGQEVSTAQEQEQFFSLSRRVIQLLCFGNKA